MPVEAQHQFEPTSPHFHLTAIDTEGPDGPEVELLVSTLARPNIRAHASLGLLYGLALMTLDQDGTIERRMTDLLDKGAINEVDAVNQINFLLLKDANDQRI